MPTAPESADDDNRYLQPKFVGWASAIGFICLLAVICWMAYIATDTLTKPQPFLDAYIKDPDNKKDLKASMAVALEYESMAIRSQGLQLAFGFVAGSILIAAGLLLFAIRVMGAVTAKGKSKVAELSLSNATPGLVVVIAGAIVLSIAILKPIKQDFAASMNQATGFDILKQSQLPPSSGKGVDLRKGQAKDD